MLCFVATSLRPPLVQNLCWDNCLVFLRCPHHGCARESRRYSPEVMLARVLATVAELRSWHKCTSECAVEHHCLQCFVERRSFFHVLTNQSTDIFPRTRDTSACACLQHRVRTREPKASPPNVDHQDNGTREATGNLFRKALSSRSLCGIRNFSDARTTYITRNLPVHLHFATHTS